MAFPLIENAEPAAERRRPPSHPGELMQEILEEHLGLKTRGAAERMGVSIDDLRAVLTGTARCSAEIALRFGRLTGGEPMLFLRMQDELDVWQERRRLAESLKRIEPMTAPVS